MAHTSGPWDCETRKFAGVKWDGIIRSEAERHPICSVFMAGYMEKEADANARLIAAAPDMLAILKKIMAGIEAKKVPDHTLLLRDGEDIVPTALSARLRDIIQKATSTPTT